MVTLSGNKRSKIKALHQKDEKVELSPEALDRIAELFLKVWMEQNGLDTEGGRDEGHSQKRPGDHQDSEKKL